MKSKACFAGNTLVKCSCILTQSRKWDGYFCAVVFWLITHIFKADGSRPTLRSDWFTTDSPVLYERQACPEQEKNHLRSSCSTSCVSPDLLWVSGWVPVPTPAGSESRSEPERTASRRRRNLPLSGCAGRKTQTRHVTGNVCLTSSCHGGCVYQRVFDGEVETFFCVSFQMFNKLEIFLVLRLHVGQHLHTLTVKTTDSEPQSSPVRLNYFRKTSRVTSHPEGHFGCVVVLVSSVPGPEMGSN